MKNWVGPREGPGRGYVASLVIAGADQSNPMEPLPGEACWIWHRPAGLASPAQFRIALTITLAAMLKKKWCVCSCAVLLGATHHIPLACIVSCRAILVPCYLELDLWVSGGLGAFRVIWK